eukprot:9760930-Heterocapsa_arctica.AAC.1
MASTATSVALQPPGGKLKHAVLLDGLPCDSCRGADRCSAQARTGSLTAAWPHRQAQPLL